MVMLSTMATAVLQSPTRDSPWIGDTSNAFCVYSDGSVSNGSVYYVYDSYGQRFSPVYNYSLFSYYTHPYGYIYDFTDDSGHVTQSYGI